MPLGAGAKLGPYEIIAPLGAGAMGEVYRARDTRLGREIAVKVLPDEVAQDAKRLVRFRREAQLLASLNHPHVAAIYGLEESDGKLLLVLELVEGEDLAERLRRGALPVDEALGVAKQVAEALEEAHEKGIVHRDLKPANIKLTPDGNVKVLDFGLAKAYAGDQAASSSDSSRSPTLTRPASELGAIVGTAAYMSPEQARGKTVDKRADVWAFGVVIVELLTGRRLFQGETVSDTLAAVLTREPDWSALPATVPRAVRTMLHDCLVRDPKQRMRDIGEARRALERVTSAASEPSEAGPSPIWRRVLPWTLAAAGMAFGAVMLLSPSQRPAAPAIPLRLSVGLGADVSLVVAGFTGAGPAMALSRDGSLLAFVARTKDGGKPRLFVRRLDQLQASPLVGTEGAHNPFFSPDGQSLAFFADGQLKRVAMSGGAPVVLAEAPNDRGGAWSEDGTILFCPNSLPGVGLSRVSSSGGPSDILTKPELAAGEATHRWPQALPGGRAVLFTAHRTLGSYDDASIVVRRLPDGPTKVVATGGYHGRYLLSGHLVYMHDGTLFAVPFDLARLEAAGTAVPAIEELVGSPLNAAAQLSCSDRGTLAYLPGRSIEARLSIQWQDRTGKLAPLRAVPGQYRNIRLSPDGTKLAMQLFDGKSSDVWVYDWARDTMSRLTFDVVGLTTPVWSPTGLGVAFSSSKGLGQIVWQRADGTGTPQVLTKSENYKFAASWHPSGRFLAFDELSPQTGNDVMILPIEGDETSGLKTGPPTAFLNSRFDELQAAFSPNGRWLAYVSNESGKFEVYVRPFPGPGGRWQVSTDGGYFPTWSRTGREIVYATPEQKLMVASYAENTGSLVVDKPRLWSEIRVPTQQGVRSFDLHPDGGRIAVLQGIAEPGDGSLDKLVLFVDFFDELRRIAPNR